MTNKQELRSKARSASAGEWIKESGEGWEAICSSDDQANAGFIVAHFEGPDAKANREFIQAANPATVLALLDELEAETSYREGAFIACNRWHDKFRESEAKLEAAEKRIAELEAREVKLPGAGGVEGTTIQSIKDWSDGWKAYREEAIKALTIAGIRINGEG